MLVKGFKDESESGNRSQGTVGKGAAKSLCRAGECLAQCPLDRTSLFPFHVKSSKRETKLDIGLLTVPVCRSTQFLEFYIW